MKKKFKTAKIIIVSVLLLVFYYFLMMFVASLHSSIYIKQFSNQKEKYSSIVKLLENNYKTNDVKETITVNISNDFNLLNEKRIIIMSEKQKEDLKYICKNSHDGNGYDYIHVDPYYIIFWQDETKYYGIMFLNNEKDGIKQFKNHYNDELQYRKIEDHWYEVGFFGI